MGQTILCVSRASAAQVTRNLVLERAGYRVLATDDPEEALQILGDSAISAVVLGETLRSDQRNALGTSFKRIRPEVPVLFLCNIKPFRVPSTVADDQVEFLGGPQLLLRALDRLLGNGEAQQDD